MTENEAIEFMKLFRKEWDKNSKTRNAEALDVAIQALEKQIPKKVVKDGKWSYKCPCCGESAKTETGDSFIDCRLDYCDGCGQRLDFKEG